MDSVTIPDFVLEHIADTVGARPPESGGALLGLRRAGIITGFLFDQHARTGSAVFHNSGELIEAIADAERRTPAQYMGILHSHPRGISSPSGQDRSEIAAALGSNPDMPVFFSPIVTFDPESPLGAHELLIDTARVSVYGSHRMPRGVELRPTHPLVAPIAATLRAASDSFTSPTLVATEDTYALHTEIDAAGCRFHLTLPLDFPTAPPLIVDDAGHRVPVLWRDDIPAHARLREALTEFRRATAVTPVGNPSTAQRSTTPAQPATPAVPDELRGALHARTGGMLSGRVHDTSVVVVGAGSIGSDLSEALTRSGVGTLTLIDPDVVEAHNLGRSRYDADDIGIAKVDALAARLRRISPTVTVHTHQASTADLTRPDLHSMIETADAVVAATDDNTAQSLINHLARHAGTPAAFVGLYARAAGGEIILSREGVPCWGCATAGARSLAVDEVERTTDYGTGRLVAEPGLVSDVQFVSAAASKIVLGLIDAPAADESESAAALVNDSLRIGNSYIVFGMRPDYWIFPAIMGDAAGQYAMQSVWMKPEYNPDCAICGEVRTNPLDFATPNRTVLQKILGIGK